MSEEGTISETTQRGLWTATDKATGKSEVGVERIQINGLSVAFSGEPVDGEVLILESRNRPSAGIGLAFQNPAFIAAGNFRVIDSEENPNGVNAKVNFTSENQALIETENELIIDNVLANKGFNEKNSAYKIFESAPAIPIAVIPAGYAGYRGLASSKYKCSPSKFTAV